MLRSSGLALLGLALSACGGASSGSGPASAKGSAEAKSGSWDDLVAAGKREGKVVVAGSPDPRARQVITTGFKDRFGIEVEYIGGNPGDVSARIERERVAGQYNVDVMLAGGDTTFGTFYPKGLLEPIKPALLLAEVADGSLWKTGQPWFRDPEGQLVLQLFNTITTTITINLQAVSPADVPTAESLLDPKWAGKIAAHDPSINGGGAIVGAALYVSKGKDFVTTLYRDHKVALSRDNQQVADWLAHASYPIGLAASQSFLEPHIKAGLTFARPRLSDVKEAVSGGFGLVCLFDHAPHPNAARVFVNWIASKEGMAAYGRAIAQAPVRNDVAVDWLEPELLPKPGVSYVDTYEYKFQVQERLKIRDFYASILK